MASQSIIRVRACDEGGSVIVEGGRGLLGGTAVEELVIPVDTKQTGARVAAARHVDTVRGGHLDVAVGQSAGEHLKPARPARQRRELIEQPVQAGILVRGAGTAHGPRD